MSHDERVILVAGGSGYIGSRTIEKLVSVDGYQVVTLIRKPLDFKHPKLTVYQGDITQESEVDKLFDLHSIDTVISCLAAKIPSKKNAYYIDYLANKQLIDKAVANHVKHFIFVSSICAGNPLLPFQQYKAKVETHLLNHFRDMTYTIFRPTAFHKDILPSVHRALKKKRAILLGSGDKASYNYIERDEFIDIMLSSLEDNQLHNRVIAIGGPKTPNNCMTHSERFDLIEKLSGETLKRVHIPMFVVNTLAGLFKIASFVIPSADAAYQIARTMRYFNENDFIGPSYGKKEISEAFEEIIKKDQETSESSH